MASCSITPNEPAGTYTLTGSFGGDTHEGAAAAGEHGLEHYVVTLEETAITYTGPVLAVTGMPFTMSAHLTTDDPTAGTPLGRAGHPHDAGLGQHGPELHRHDQRQPGTPAAPSATSWTNGGCHQTAGSVPIAVTFAGDAYYRPAERLRGSHGDRRGRTVEWRRFVVGDVSAGAPTNGTR